MAAAGQGVELLAFRNVMAVLEFQMIQWRWMSFARSGRLGKFSPKSIPMITCENSLKAKNMTGVLVILGLSRLLQT
jgi:hypothetical protein